MLYSFILFSIIFLLIFPTYDCDDNLTPYVKRHGPSHSNKFVKSCQPIHYGNLTHEIYPADRTVSISGINRVEYFSTKVGNDNHRITGHLVFVNNPNHWLTLMEPGGPAGCQKRRRETILQTSEIYHCEAAANAGFFNTHTSQCLGNVVINGRVVRDSGGVQNAHFGLTRTGQLFFGYISEKEVLSSTFTTLVGGVVWLVRRGSNYVPVSARAECEKTEETGAMTRFIGVRSARMAVGHDREGRLVLAHVDGKTDQAGVNLNEFANLLISFGIVNAINLDGGGSSTLVINQTIVNYPSDNSPANPKLLRLRPVTTGLCVRSPSCSPTGPVACAGLCLNGGSCDFISGRCLCPPGYLGILCERSCPKGFWGKGCRRLCTCADAACEVCHHVTGNCNITTAECCNTQYSLRKDGRATEQDTTWLAVLITLAVISVLSIIINISLLCSRCKTERPHYHLLRNSPRSSPMRGVRFMKAVDDDELNTVQSADRG